VIVDLFKVLNETFTHREVGREPDLCFLRPRARVGVDRFKRRVPNFRCADARVSEQSLDHSYISAVLQHVGCHAVPEGMRVDSLLDAGQCDPLVVGSRDGARKDSTFHCEIKTGCGPSGFLGGSLGLFLNPSARCF
jgi:hypothetical protein